MEEQAKVESADLPTHDRLIEMVREHPEQAVDILGIAVVMANVLIHPERVGANPTQCIVLGTAAGILRDYILEFQRQIREFWVIGGCPITWQDGVPQGASQVEVEGAAGLAQFDQEQDKQDRPVEFPPEEM